MIKTISENLLFILLVVIALAISYEWIVSAGWGLVEWLKLFYDQTLTPK